MRSPGEGSKDHASLGNFQQRSRREEGLAACDILVKEDSGEEGVTDLAGRLLAGSWPRKGDGP